MLMASAVTDPILRLPEHVGHEEELLSPRHRLLTTKPQSLENRGPPPNL